jgi:hypothetical protein
MIISIKNIFQDGYAVKNAEVLGFQSPSPFEDGWEKRKAKNARSADGVKKTQRPARFQYR